jgi:hypothetical protein
MVKNSATDSNQGNPAAPQPQPQRQDGRNRGRKGKKDLNKKSKEGSDMDAFYDTQVTTLFILVE